MRRFHKAGIHVHSGGVSVWELVGCAAVTYADCEPDLWNEVSRQSPETWGVVRKVFGQQEQRILLTDPIIGAHLWFERLKPWMDATPVGAKIVWQGLNEISEDQSDKYLEFELERLRLCRLAGRHIGVGAWSVGVLSPGKYAQFKPLFDDLDPENDAILKHCYWGHAKHVLNPWYTLPWRFPEVRNAVGPNRWIITEAGRDIVRDKNVPRDEWGKGGWLADGIPLDQYVDELGQYAEALEIEPSVVGYTAFDHGVGVRYGWQDYDMAKPWPIIHDWIKSHPACPSPTPAELGYPFEKRLRVSSEFAAGHWAIDLAATNSEWYAYFHGTPVLSMIKGKAYVGHETDGKNGGLGLFVVIYNEAWRTYYSHLSEAWVANNEVVKVGQPIGAVGYSGNTLPGGIAGTHLDVQALKEPIDWGAYGGRVNPSLYWHQPTEWWSPWP